MTEKVDAILDEHRKKEGSTISLLQDIQEAFGYIPEDAVAYAADRLDMPLSKFFGVATFYAQFYLKPRGKNIITACCGTACHVKGSDRLISRLLMDLEIPAGEDTSKDMQFTVERVNCVGACSIAPVVIINKAVHGKMTSEALAKEMKNLKGGEE